jgi:hypothetical protein
MMVNVRVHAYAIGTFSSRRIARRLEEDVRSSLPYVGFHRWARLLADTMRAAGDPDLCPRVELLHDPDGLFFVEPTPPNFWPPLALG